MNEFTPFLVGFLALGAGAALGYYARQTIAKQQEGTAEARINKLIVEANAKAQNLVLQARNKAMQALEDAKKEEQERKREVSALENRLVKKEEALEAKSADFGHKEEELLQKAEKVRELKENLEALRQKRMEELEHVAQLSISEAKEMLFTDVESSYKNELHDRLFKLEQYGKEELEQRAKDMIALAIQRYAASQSAEITTTTVALPSDDIKGRIIGREGRNIKALERLTGVELIVDDAPEAIVISGFDAVRRHIAKLALEKLVTDERLQTARSQ